MKTIFIGGITGQIGAYLADHFAGLTEEVQIIGLVRRSATPNTRNITHLLGLQLSNGEPFVKLEYCDMTDYGSIVALLQKYQPDEFYNFAAQSHVRISYDLAHETHNSIAIGASNCLEGIRLFSSHTKYYNAASSEQFGSNIDPDGFQRETTPFSPNSPYAVAKLSSYHTTRLYREAYGLFSASAINFNTESPRRGENFVTRKITKYVGELYKYITYNNRGEFPLLSLGNLDASRDWSYAADSARAAHMILQQEEPDDFVIASGETHTIREFLTEAFEYIEQDWHNWVTFDSSLLRAKEVSYLRGDASKAKRVLHYRPSVTFKELVKLMVDHDIATAHKDTYATR